VSGVEEKPFQASCQAIFTYIGSDCEVCLGSMFYVVRSQAGGYFFKHQAVWGNVKDGLIRNKKPLRP